MGYFLFALAFYFLYRNTKHIYSLFSNENYLERIKQVTKGRTFDYNKIFVSMAITSGLFILANLVFCLYVGNFYYALYFVVLTVLQVVFLNQAVRLVFQPKNTNIVYYLRTVDILDVLYRLTFVIWFIWQFFN